MASNGPSRLPTYSPVRWLCSVTHGVANTWQELWLGRAQNPDLLGEAHWSGTPRWGWDGTWGGTSVSLSQRQHVSCEREIGGLARQLAVKWHRRNVARWRTPRHHDEQLRF